MTFDTMMPSEEPDDVQTIACDDTRLTPYNINNTSSQSTKDRLSELEAIAEQYFLPGSIKRLAGSTSVILTPPATERPKVLVNLLPREPGPSEFIKLGISASLNRLQWGDQEFGGPECIARQAFFTFDLPNSTEGLDIASMAFEELAGCVLEEDESEA